MQSQCVCGGVEFEAIGAPIASVVCYCASCQRAGRGFEALFGAPPLLEPDGGTAMIMFRKDRVRCLRGREKLQGHRLKPDLPTRRLVATCCNSAMLLDVNGGHWLSMYGRQFPSGAPAVEMRVWTKDRRASAPLDPDAPSARGFSGRVILKLLAAWAAMGFRRPKFDDG
jgi:hypothetical protein